jgi:SnoaL-like domain
MDPVEELRAIEEIRQVKYCHLRCFDLKLWDEIGDTFTPDATVDYGTMVYGQPLKISGRDRIVEFFPTKLGPDIITVHSAGQPEITADLSFQVLKGDYSPAEVPDSLSAFDDRAIEIGADGAFELRFGPADPAWDATGPNRFRLGAGSSMLLVREVYGDWDTERRGTIGIRRADRAGCAPPAIPGYQPSKR